jgi:5-methylcytosine-specific restriction endonuclease McrA
VRPGGERRGNSRDRQARRVWLLATFDQDLGPDKARCWLDLSPLCREYVDLATLTVDRINPGGSYRRDNIQPACRPCQSHQGALITKERRDEWRQYMAEAEAAGIEWDGAM